MTQVPILQSWWQILCLRSSYLLCLFVCFNILTGFWACLLCRKILHGKLQIIFIIFSWTDLLSFLTPGRRSIWCYHIFYKIHRTRWECNGLQSGQRAQVPSWSQHCAPRHQARKSPGTFHLFSNIFFLTFFSLMQMLVHKSQKAEQGTEGMLIWNIYV